MIAGAAFFALHALAHLGEELGAHSHSFFWNDLPAVYLPTLLALWLAFARSPQAFAIPRLHAVPIGQQWGNHVTEVRPTMDRVLVTGATGHLGRELVPGSRRGCVICGCSPGSPASRKVSNGLLVISPPERVWPRQCKASMASCTLRLSPIARRGSIRLQDFFSTPTEVDVDGTRRLLEASKNRPRSSSSCSCQSSGWSTAACRTRK